MLYSAQTRGFYDPAIHTAIPADAQPITAALYAALMAGQATGQAIVPDAAGHPVLAAPPAPTPEQIEAAVVAAVQGRLDAFARTRNYDGILSACTYATSAVAKFKAEGQCCVNARDAHWNACYSILADVQAGVRAMPSVAQVLSEMPALAWPQ